MREKLDFLKKYLNNLQSVVIAFSGGIDSTFLLQTAHNILGNNAVAVTAQSCLFPEREMEWTKKFCADNGIRQIILKHDALSIDEVKKNPPNRCYFCKRELFSKMKMTAAELGIPYIAEGSNTDDSRDYRPGAAAVKELRILSPLREAGLGKAEIRALSKEAGLSTWEKPSLACLASRIPYGDEITADKLAMIERAEQFLSGRGFGQLRVRAHGSMARIEVEKSEFSHLTDMSDEVCDYFSGIGFKYVSLDLRGYKTGSMNETLSTGNL